MSDYQRALDELGIELIHADSSQAKGRVERLFGILQGRLIKGMRLAQIKTIDEANEFLEYYLPLYNKRFSKIALKEGDLHNPLPEEVDLREIFCLKDIQSINNGFIVRWKGRKFLIDNASIAMRRRKMEVREHFDGEFTIKFNGRYLDFHEVFELKPVDHPWRRDNPTLHHNSYLKRIQMKSKPEIIALLKTGSFCVALTNIFT